MSDDPAPVGRLGTLLLARSRALLRTRIGALMVTFVAILYGFVSLLIGQMLVVGPNAYRTVQVTVWTGAGDPAWWNFPALVVTAPGAVLVLPFLATVTMVVVSLGVGLGMSVGLVLAYRLIRRQRSGAAGPASLGTVSGLTPAMIALVTLGACCSTTVAATAGIGVVAQASGTSIANVLSNTWYLNLFQVGVLWVALVAQEQLLSVYGRLLGGDVPSAGTSPRATLDGRFVAGALLRAGLVGAGVTWALAMFAEWTAPSAPGPTATLAYQWVIQHELLALFAVAAGLFVLGTYRWLRDPTHRSAALALRGALFVGGGSLLTWTPPVLASAGAYGLVNEIFGAVGLPASWGAVAPPSTGPLLLALRWGLQFGLLGAFAVAAALAPESAFLPLQWTTEPRPTPPLPGTTSGIRRGTPVEPPAPVVREAVPHAVLAKAENGGPVQG
ncbi:MAG: hypothetical protein L3K16_02765 [Thermoplasmata archaeon]|nr:hypothetical protein [Thermoplasmata archaeon]